MSNGLDVEVGVVAGEKAVKGEEPKLLVTDDLGTIVGGSGLLEGEGSLMGSSLGSVLVGEGHTFMGCVGLREELEVELLPAGEDLLATFMFCCMRQWILNQLDLLPYLDPDFDMPTIRHFLSLQALQAVLFFLSTTQR